MMDTEKKRLHAIVEGRVQGVGFRYFVVDIADTLGVDGWVRNRWDESVEVVVEGEEQVLNQFLERLKRGPRGSFILGVKIEWQTATGEYVGFHLKPTV
jgi:acylphosphatase